MKALALMMISVSGSIFASGGTEDTDWYLQCLEHYQNIVSSYGEKGNIKELIGMTYPRFSVFDW